MRILGLSAEAQSKLQRLVADGQSVTLRLKAEEKCKFLRKAKRVEESASKSVTKVGLLKIQHSVETTITDHFFELAVNYQLIAFAGPAPSEGTAVVLSQRQDTTELKTGSEELPKPAVTVRPSVDVDATGLLAMLQGDVVDFSIDRSHAKCRTPSNNPEVLKARTCLANIGNWGQQVAAYFSGVVFPLRTGHKLDLAMARRNDIFSPVVPLFERRAPTGTIQAAKKRKVAEEDDEEAAPSALTVTDTVETAEYASQVMLPLSDIELFLAEQVRSAAEVLRELAVAFPTEGLITVAEATICVVCIHLQSLSTDVSRVVAMLESMLRSGIRKAIGHEVSPQEFAAYMVYHNRKLFREAFQPRPFCYAVRRPDHYPEGTLAIEANVAGSPIPQPVATTCRRVPNGRAMFFDISAATSVEFHGDRYLHSMILHSFAHQDPNPMRLVARARQFSSFILLVGKISSATQFSPEAAMVISNKDELSIPLNMERIPTPKEFRDAIESLSPEQQDFCKAFRSMQLESTLFGVLVVQIKPQLELLLNLPNDSLTKEIRLSQELQELFIKYQIPSDLLKYEGDPAADVETKVASVKASVKAITDMIDGAKRQELEAKEKEREMQRREAELVLQLSMEESKRSQNDMLMRRGLGGGGGMKGSTMMRGRAAVPMAMARSMAPAPSMMARSMAPSPPMALSMASCAPVRAAGPPPPAAGPPPPAAGPPPPAGGRPSPAPQPASQRSEAPAEPAAQQKEPGKHEPIADDGDGDVTTDLTKLPALLEAKMLLLDTDSALRPTIISAGDRWSLRRQKSLMSSSAASSLNGKRQSTEKTTAFDFLDALSRSGSLPITEASLHVVVASTHCFDQNIMDTLVRDNVNPIDKVERSSLIVASVVHGHTIEDMVRPNRLGAVRQVSPNLIQ